MHIPFNIPDEPASEWQVLEKIIHEVLESRKASEVMIQHVSEKMKSAWMQHQFEYSFPLEDGNKEALQAVLDLHTALKTHVTRLIFSRLLLEVELAQAQGIS